ncbi:hypothetical protein [Nocardia tengchongensis]|uniref:hypothetical protein n=1 Tax=Nocardia tengchongensis TaxID=2055889 RepID=UPI0036B85123
MTISEHTSTRHRLARAFVLGALVVLPIGFAGPALAEPLTLADNNNWNGNQNRQQTPWWCQFGSC